MAHPKRRQSHSRTHKRRAHDALTPIQTQSCPKCGSPKLAHRVCGACGFYGKDNKVLEVENPTA